MFLKKRQKPEKENRPISRKASTDDFTDDDESSEEEEATGMTSSVVFVDEFGGYGAPPKTSS